MAKLVFTGGHHNSALVLAQYFQSHQHDVVWIGHRHSSRGDTNDSAEYLEVKASNIPFHNLETGRLLPTLKEILKIPLGVKRAISLLRQIRPDKVITFGGYLGASVALAAFILHIPVYLHEQTVTAGKANKFIARFAKKIYLTWDESRPYFPSSKSQVVGLPLRLSLTKKSRTTLFVRHKPTLLIMGGKQGASVINNFVFSHLHDLLSHFNIVHQTGTSSVTHDYEHALALVESLGSLADSYLPMGYISENLIGKYLYSSDYYLGRSGAHICYELALTRLPCILIPLTITHDIEQYKNAKILERAKQGVILPQSELSLTHFHQSLTLLNNQKSKSLKLPLDATETMYHDILKV
jgi:UDP-N-acetylglucosamine--N-acetylmuramyl-(pentapeptide) pyrophosphoryl-undecaprenol N-acetylglucosamine transferase